MILSEYIEYVVNIIHHWKLVLDNSIFQILLSIWSSPVAPSKRLAHSAAPTTAVWRKNKRDMGQNICKTAKVQWLFLMIYPLVAWHSYGKSPCLMGKITISMAMLFNSYMKVITRWYIPFILLESLFLVPLNPIESPVNHHWLCHWWILSPIKSLCLVPLELHWITTTLW